MDPILSKVRHVGFIVKDLDATVGYLSEALRLGPFKIVEPDFFDRADYFERKYKGEDEDFRFRIAFVSVGGLELEFIQPVKGRTIYVDFLKEKGGGLHHLAYDVKDLDDVLKQLNKHGVKVVMSGKRKGLSWAYVEVNFMNGLILELMDWHHRNEDSGS